MSLETLFLLCNYGVMPAWLLLAVAPRWIWTQRIVHSALVPLVLGSVYLVGFSTAPPAPEGAGFGSLAGVMLFFSVPQAVLVGWVHYLVFDLFVGAWEVRDARRHGIHHGLVLPCLFFTLMLGPIGLLLYLMLRAARTRDLLLDEAPTTPV
jgi:hypothetical protein